MAEGIEQANRALLERLHRATAGPFTIAEAAEVLHLDHSRAARLARYLAARGWLSRIRRGLYTTVPLGARDPSSWREDPWLVATRVFAPCYIGGWSAAEHWSLTEQLFREVVVITARPVRATSTDIQGQAFHVKHAPEDQHFGLATIWRERVRTSVSDPSKTVVDILDDPAIGGGIRHVAAVVSEYWTSEHLDSDRLVAYVHRLGNRTVFKRLGFILEESGMDAAETIRVCRESISAGLSPLDPTVKRKGRIVKRWNLRVNAKIKAGASS